jgi:hypothetical protein
MEGIKQQNSKYGRFTIQPQYTQPPSKAVYGPKMGLIQTQEPTDRNNIQCIIQQHGRNQATELEIWPVHHSATIYTATIKSGTWTQM